MSTQKNRMSTKDEQTKKESKQKNKSQTQRNRRRTFEVRFYRWKRRALVEDADVLLGVREELRRAQRLPMHELRRDRARARAVEHRGDERLEKLKKFAVNFGEAAVGRGRRGVGAEGRFGGREQTKE